MLIDPGIVCGDRTNAVIVYFAYYYFYLFIDDAVQVFLARRAQHAEDVVQLVEVVLPREDGPVGQHLRQDAAHRPDVYRLGVALHNHNKRHSNKALFTDKAVI